MSQENVSQYEELLQQRDADRKKWRLINEEFNIPRSEKTSFYAISKLIADEDKKLDETIKKIDAYLTTAKRNDVEVFDLTKYKSELGNRKVDFANKMDLINSNETRLGILLQENKTNTDMFKKFVEELGNNISVFDKPQSRSKLDQLKSSLLIGLLVPVEEMVGNDEHLHSGLSTQFELLLKRSTSTPGDLEKLFIQTGIAKKEAADHLALMIIAKNRLSHINNKNSFIEGLPDYKEFETELAKLEKINKDFDSLLTHIEASMPKMAKPMEMSQTLANLIDKRSRLETELSKLYTKGPLDSISNEIKVKKDEIVRIYEEIKLMQTSIQASIKESVTETKTKPSLSSPPAVQLAVSQQPAAQPKIGSGREGRSSTLSNSSSSPLVSTPSSSPSASPTSSPVSPIPAAASLPPTSPVHPRVAALGGGMSRKGSVTTEPSSLRMSSVTTPASSQPARISTSGTPVVTDSSSSTDSQHRPSGSGHH